MGLKSGENNAAYDYDGIIVQIVDYVYTFEPTSSAAWSRAKVALLDALGCAIESFHSSAECRHLVGPTLGSPRWLPDGVTLPGTAYRLDLLKGAFGVGSMIRYLDHNDAYPGAEWGHPSDNLGAIITAAEVISRSTGKPILMKTVLQGLIKAYEIQGCFQIKNAFNRIGLDHVILVKVASTAVVSWMLGLEKEQALSAVSHAWVDGHPLRVYRQAPNTGPRKGWAAGDACLRAVQLALAARSGQPGMKTALTAPKWGFYDALFKSASFELPRPFGSWVMENVLFKVNTAEGHGMTAIEAALEISEALRNSNRKPEDIASIAVRTQEAGMIIINKAGPLHNAADRDHCLRYMVAVVFFKGSQIDTEDYQNASPWARDPRVAALREKIAMAEDAQFTADYHDPDVRSVTNALCVEMSDGAQFEALVEYPLGHVRRRETTEEVYKKARRNMALRLPKQQVGRILETVQGGAFGEMPASEFMDMYAIEEMEGWNDRNGH
ncbi:MmgE/PrpD family-domain-containing protein [Lophiotrema nucula]|uniref:MmgE/PrpD family-domain-containing protein n=1 Tax=Lophiotrema nucula TaxID=690887 RepID=A0A6A5YM63_9PLEO|nr:MmgE/PrpD family-domain-containing protein [Lophiotrema nucula]